MNKYTFFKEVETLKESIENIRQVVVALGISQDHTQCNDSGLLEAQTDIVLLELAAELIERTFPK